MYMHAQEKCKYVHQKTGMKMLTAALFPKPQSRKTQKSINSRMDEQWYSHIAEHDTAMRVLLGTKFG